jgi:hypothetical protein
LNVALTYLPQRSLSAKSSRAGCSCAPSSSAALPLLWHKGTSVENLSISLLSLHYPSTLTSTAQKANPPNFNAASRSLNCLRHLPGEKTFEFEKHEVSGRFELPIVLVVLSGRICGA